MLTLTVRSKQPLMFSRNGVPIGSVTLGKRHKGANQARLHIDGFEGIDVLRGDAKDQTPAQWEDDWPEGNGNKAFVSIKPTRPDDFPGNIEVEPGRGIGLHGFRVKGPAGVLEVWSYPEGLSVVTFGRVDLTPAQFHAMAEEVSGLPTWSETVAIALSSQAARAKARASAAAESTLNPK